MPENKTAESLIAEAADTENTESAADNAKKHGSRELRDLRKWIRFFSIASVLLIAAFALAAAMAFSHYKTYPGRVERDSISSPGRGSDYIVIGWDKARNTDVYKVWYRENVSNEAADDAKDAGSDSNAEGAASENGEKEGEFVPDDSWTELETEVPEITVEGLREGTSYSFVVRADNKKKEGVATEPRRFSTKKPQKIKADRKITKFTCSKPFKIDVSAETDLMYESDDPEVAVVDPSTQEIRITGAGVARITITARSSRKYDSASKTVELRVIDASPVDAGGASPIIIYELTPDNCEIVKRITGADGAVVPQGLGYSGDKYIVAYGMGNPDRIISFDADGDDKEVSVPSVSMGHPNGFTYADENGLCYCVRGWTSTAYTYEPESDSYGSVNLSYGCSGIGYDRKEKLLYTCSRTAMVAYDISDGYSVKYRCGVVSHSGSVYTQDCGGHAGIMFRCLSGADKHGINYIDLYDMKNGRYLGTFTCDLSEVESCIVDKDGFLEILSNNSSNEDYIWKTDLNIDTLGEGL